MRKKKSRIPRSNKRWREFLRRQKLATDKQLIQAKLSSLGLDVDLRDTPDVDSADGLSQDQNPDEDL